MTSYVSLFFSLVHNGGIYFRKEMKFWWWRDFFFLIIEKKILFRACQLIFVRFYFYNSSKIFFSLKLPFIELPLCHSTFVLIFSKKFFIQSISKKLKTPVEKMKWTKIKGNRLWLFLVSVSRSKNIKFIYLYCTFRKKCFFLSCFDYYCVHGVYRWTCSVYTSRAV